jgi:hypothetical protein
VQKVDSNLLLSSKQECVYVYAGANLIMLKKYIPSCSFSAVANDAKVASSLAIMFLIASKEILQLR